MSDSAFSTQPTPLQSYNGWLELVREIRSQCLAVTFAPAEDNQLGGKVRVARDPFASKIHIELDLTVNGRTTTATGCIWEQSSEWQAGEAERVRTFKEKLDELFLGLMKPQLQATADHLMRQMAGAELRQLLG